jgi:hypothetical protein
MTELDCPTPTKIRHTSREHALKQLASLRRSQPLGPDWNAYLCRCTCWHVGHQPGALEKRIQDALRVRHD